MTPKSRLEAVLSGEQTDRPPCICPGGMMNLVVSELLEKSNIHFIEAHHNATVMAEIADAVYRENCFENYGVPFCMTVEAEEMGALVDYGDNYCEPHVTHYVIQSVDDWQLLQTPTTKGGRSKVVLDALQILKEKNPEVPVIGNITGPISTASSVMEPVVFYKELRKKNRKAHEMMAFVTEKLIQFAVQQVEAGAEVIAISDPSGTGEIMGPKLFEEFTVPYLNQLVEAIRDKGAVSIVHICGQMKQVYPQIDLVKSDVLSFDSVVAMKDAKKNLPERLIMGNVSTFSIEFATPDKVMSLTQSCLRSGADIISPACGLGMNSPLENVQAMLKSLKESGR